MGVISVAAAGRVGRGGEAPVAGLSYLTHETPFPILFALTECAGKQDADSSTNIGSYL